MRQWVVYLFFLSFFYFLASSSLPGPAGVKAPFGSRSRRNHLSLTERRWRTHFKGECARRFPSSFSFLAARRPTVMVTSEPYFEHTANRSAGRTADWMKNKICRCHSDRQTYEKRRASKNENAVNKFDETDTNVHLKICIVCHSTFQFSCLTYLKKQKQKTKTKHKVMIFLSSISTNIYLYACVFSVI